KRSPAAPNGREGSRHGPHGHLVRPADGVGPAHVVTGPPPLDPPYAATESPAARLYVHPTVAAHLLQLALKGHNLDKHFVVSSAGIAAVPGQPAAAHAIEAMAAYGASLEGHRSRSLDRDLVD